MASPPNEHRELTLPERIDRLEKAIEFDSLPLRKLKDWLEGDLLLDPNTNIYPGIADPDEFFPDPLPEGGSTAAQGGGSHLRPYPNLATNDFMVPTWPAGALTTSQAIGGAGAVSQLYVVRFVAARDLTVTSILLMMTRTAAENATNDKFAVGLYNNAGTSLLGSSPNKLISTDLGVGTSGHYPASFVLSAATALTAGVVYTFALNVHSSATAGIAALAGATSHGSTNEAIIRKNGGTITVDADIRLWSVSYSENAGAACGGSANDSGMPATISTGGCGGGSITLGRVPLLAELIA